jgi:hypothetical protein
MGHEEPFKMRRRKEGSKAPIRPPASAFLVIDAEPDRVIIVSS